MYECVICLSVNHSSRLHCQNCGAVPSRYSFNGKTYVAKTDSNGETTYVSIEAAVGCSRSVQHKAQRLYLKTVAADYYAEGSAE